VQSLRYCSISQIHDQALDGGTINVHIQVIDDDVEALKLKNVCLRDIKTQNILYSSI